MEKLVFKLNERLYLRDPQSSELGQKITGASVLLIDKLGFEDFTFKKLADEIGSTEASIYRYFLNKHRLLLYLIDWYWNWLEYQLDLKTMSLIDKKEKLRAALRVLAEEKEFDPVFEGIDESALHRIVVAEMDKTYLTKQVDDDNQVGLFLQLKSVSRKIAKMITEVNPQFPFSNSLSSTVIMIANQQLFFTHHLPALSDIKHTSLDKHEDLFTFLETLVFKSIV